MEKRLGTAPLNQVWSTLSGRSFTRLAAVLGLLEAYKHESKMLKPFPNKNEKPTSSATVLHNGCAGYSTFLAGTRPITCESLRLKKNRPAQSPPISLGIHNATMACSRQIPQFHNNQPHRKSPNPIRISNHKDNGERRSPHKHYHNSC